MARAVFSFLCFIFLLLPTADIAAAGDILFNISQRRKQLQQPDFAPARNFCMARNIILENNIPPPITKLHSTKGYGADNRPEAYTWYVMVQGGRALAGDAEASNKLKAALLSWAHAGALLKSEISHDVYYALKRYMLPVIINYAVISPQLTKAEQKTIEDWISKIVLPLDKNFGGDVDHNNHRYLTDSVLMAWGAYTNNKILYKTGVKGFIKALKDARSDGSFPLETRRGARATWYMRHSLASLTLIASIARQHGDNLFEHSERNVSLDRVMNYFLNSHYAPIFILPWASQNHIPGPYLNYRLQDREYLWNRPHGRNYMAFVEAYTAQHNSFASKRLGLLASRTSFTQRPLFDEYIGGNASCFFWHPTQ